MTSTETSISPDDSARSASSLISISGTDIGSLIVPFASCFSTDLCSPDSISMSTAASCCVLFGLCCDSTSVIGATKFGGDEIDGVDVRAMLSGGGFVDGFGCCGRIGGCGACGADATP